MRSDGQLPVAAGNFRTSGYYLLIVLPIVTVVFIIMTAIPAASADKLLNTYREGRKLMLAGQYTDALEKFASIRASYKTLQDYLIFDEAFSLEKIGEIPLAIERYREIIKFHRNSPLYRRAFRRILDLGRISRPDLVSEDYHLYLKEFPDDNKVILELAQIFDRAGKSQEARSLYRQVFLSGGSNALIGLNYLRKAGEPPSLAEKKQVAFRLVERELYDDAISLLKTLSLKDQDEESRFLLGKAYFNRRRYIEAIKTLEKTRHREGRTILASSLVRSNERARFFRLVDEMAKEGRKDIFRLQYAMAEMKRREGNHGEAREIFNSMLAIYPDRIDEITWGLAWLDIRMRRFPEAEKTLLTLTQARAKPLDKHLFWLGKVQAYQGKCSRDAFSQIRDSNGYYWLTVNQNRFPAEMAKAAANTKEMPDSLLLLYARISDLSYLRMLNEASNEARIALNLITPSQVEPFAQLFLAIEDYHNLTRLGIRNNILRHRYPPAFLRLVKTYADKHGLDPLLIISIMREESLYQPTAVSRAGAMGVMQLMPSTARRLGKVERNEQLFEVERNIALASEYLAKLLGQFPLLEQAIAAYNAGANRVRRWLDTAYLDVDEFIEDIPFAETRNYVLKVMRTYHLKNRLYAGQLKAHIKEALDL